MYIDLIGDTLDVFLRGINNGDVVMFFRQVAGNGTADKTGTTYDNFHYILPMTATCPHISPSTPSDFSLRCSAERSIPTKTAIRETLPPNRLSWAAM